MSIPRVLGTALETIPAEVPYLQADPADRERFAQALGECSGLRIGLVWAGNNRPGEATVSLHRNLPLDSLKPLLAIPGVSFVNLQMGGAAALADLPPEMRPLDLMEDIRDFADTAALVEGLDLVISVDTAVAHLAGALGKPVWMFQRLNNDWRWLMARSDSPWYPCLRMYRQTSLGDWLPVIAAIKTDLEALVSRHQSVPAEARPSPEDKSHADLIRATRIAIQSAVSRSGHIADYLEAPIEGVPDVLGKLEAFCRDRQSLTDVQWQDGLSALLNPDDRPTLIRLRGCTDPMSVLPALQSHCPGLYRLFLADEVLLLLRKDALFDFCSSVFIETGVPTIFHDFIGEIVSGAMGKSTIHRGNFG